MDGEDLIQNDLELDDEGLLADDDGQQQHDLNEIFERPADVSHF
jgi:hypothetical protein